MCQLIKGGTGFGDLWITRRTQPLQSPRRIHKRRHAHITYPPCNDIINSLIFRTTMQTFSIAKTFRISLQHFKRTKIPSHHATGIYRFSLHLRASVLKRPLNALFVSNLSIHHPSIPQPLPKMPPPANLIIISAEILASLMPIHPSYNHIRLFVRTST
jgi:hypothetical protein